MFLANRIARNCRVGLESLERSSRLFLETKERSLRWRHEWKVIRIRLEITIEKEDTIEKKGERIYLYT